MQHVQVKILNRLSLNPLFEVVAKCCHRCQTRLSIVIGEDTIAAMYQSFQSLIILPLPCHLVSVLCDQAERG